MGEPLTKIALLLLGLCIEYKVRATLRVVPDTVFYILGGDDNFSIGPIQYCRELQRVTREEAFMVISTSKDLILPVGEKTRIIRFCEKSLDLKYIGTWAKPRSNVTSDYEESPWVDSVPVRVFSRIEPSNRVASNEKNVAIGKGQELARTFRWLPPSTYNTERRRLIREYFFHKMVPLIPRVRNTLFYQLLCPAYLGGLGLWLEEDIPLLAEKLPSVTLRVMEGLNQGLKDTPSVKSALVALSAFLRNSSNRGIEMSIGKSMTFHAITEKYLEGIDGIKCDRLYEILNIEKPSRVSTQYHVLKAHGWWSFGEVANLLMKADTMQELLLQEERVPKYNSMSWEKRVKEITRILNPYLGKLKAKGIERISVENIKSVFLKTVLLHKDVLYPIKPNFNDIKEGLVLPWYEKDHFLENNILEVINEQCPSLRVDIVRNEDHEGPEFDAAKLQVISESYSV
jgi:hypothetical protein